MMQSTVVTGLESLSRWRAEVDRALLAAGRFLREHDLDNEAGMARLALVRERLATERIIIAFVAEFSRGKSELVNAIFFAGAGRRVMPATPGRTTMCPVELLYDASRPTMLSLLPVETRLRGLSLSELRRHEDAWERVPLDANNPEGLALAMQAVTRTRRVSAEQAAALGFGQEGDELESVTEDGSVEVPAWRHAVINYPHPLLQRGLVVIDTPGLNAIGAEPELTLGLLPSAHATVFLLGADTGVTKSDLAVWREHLSGSSLERFVVLNKIDTLVDPLATDEAVQEQIASQCAATARQLELPPARIFPLSARAALAGRIGGDDGMLRASRLPDLEAALADELMPRQRELLAASATDAVRALRAAAMRQVGDRRRQCAEQLLELRGLRGKSNAKLRLLQQRLVAETEEFEGCTVRLSALRAVHARMLSALLGSLSSDVLRREVTTMQAAIGDGPLLLGARKAFGALATRLRTIVRSASAQTLEMRQMLDASSKRLNADFGFAFLVIEPPSLMRFDSELSRIEDAYGRFLSFTQAWRFASPVFREQFRRMLLSKLRMVFESAASEIELWSKSISAPMDQQLRDRRQAFQRRHDALERIEGAAGELESRIREVEGQEQRLQALLQKVEAAMAQAQGVIERGADDAIAIDMSVVPVAAQRDAA